MCNHNLRVWVCRSFHGGPLSPAAALSGGRIRQERGRRGHSSAKEVILEWTAEQGCVEAPGYRVVQGETGLLGPRRPGPSGRGAGSQGGYAHEDAGQLAETEPEGVPVATRPRGEEDHAQ
jgi:hypothetical protein